MFATQKQGWYSHWQNFDVNGLFPDKNMLMVTLTGKTCYDSHYRSDQQVKTELYDTLKKVYKNATMPVGK